MNFRLFMQNHQHNALKIFFLIAITLAYTGCGKKRKNIFYFPPLLKKKESLIKLHLPAIKGIHLKKQDNHLRVEWKPVDLQSLLYNPEIKCLGYNVYAFPNNGFIPHKPINSIPCQNTFIIVDALKPQCSSLCYLVTAIFQYDEQIIEGPASKIICSK